MGGERQLCQQNCKTCCGELSSDLGVGCGAARPMVVGVMQMPRHHGSSGDRAHINWFQVGGKAE